MDISGLDELTLREINVNNTGGDAVGIITPDSSGAGTNLTLSVVAVSGADVAGKNLTIAAGQGTGTGAGGNIVFQTADGSGTSGSDTNNLATAMTIIDNGNVGIGKTPECILDISGNEGQIKLKSTNSAKFSNILLESSGGDQWQISGPRGATEGNLGFYYVDDGTYSSELLSITKDGKTTFTGGIEITGGNTGFNMENAGFLRIAGNTGNSSSGYNSNACGIVIKNTGNEPNYWQIWPQLIDASRNRLVFYFSQVPIGAWIEGGTAGTSIQMNFTGQHRTLANKNIGINQEGLIVSSDNDYVNLDNGVSPTINESLPVISLSNTDYDKKVFGVISNLEDDNNDRDYLIGSFGTTYEKTNYDEQRLIVNSLGEGSIWICNKNGIFENGDFITSSSVVGYGIKQNDDLLHNYTVGKITCNCDFSLIKVPEQQLKTTAGTSGQVIDYDSNGNLQFENKTDSEGNVILDYKFQTRFLQADGTLLTDEADYTTRLGNGEEVYIACFVGCTYHCG